MDEITKIISEIENIDNNVIRVIKYSDLVLYLNYLEKCFKMQETNDPVKDAINNVIHNAATDKIKELKDKMNNMIKFNITGKK